jgi:hypothetical protein
MNLVKIPRGREGARPIDAHPVAHPHGPSHIETQLYPHGGEPPAQAAEAWIGWKAVDEFGRSAGRIEGLVGDEWLIVRGRRGHHFLAPTHDAIAGGAQVFLPYEHDLIISAPEVTSFEEVEPAAIDEARRHYALPSLTPAG